MRLQDLHQLPKVRDSLSYLYLERCRIEQEDRAIAVYDTDGITPVPCAALTLLMLGPGVAISHAAVLSLADCGCLVVWVGEWGVRFYACGLGETRSASRLLHQARLVTHPPHRLIVVRRLYEMRFGEQLAPELRLEQIRGREGARVRDAYAHASAQSGVAWNGRAYDRGQWDKADPVNRALSAANACLYGLCHAAIVSTGYSPAMGFIHTGKQLSFVYDIGDLYKVDLTIPVAFEAVASGQGPLERTVRYKLRDRFAQGDFLGRIIKDIEYALSVDSSTGDDGEPVDYDDDPAAPGQLWDEDHENVPGGTLHVQNPPTDQGGLPW